MPSVNQECRRINRIRSGKGTHFLHNFLLVRSLGKRLFQILFGRDLSLWYINENGRSLQNIVQVRFPFNHEIKMRFVISERDIFISWFRTRPFAIPWFYFYNTPIRSVFRSSLSGRCWHWSGEFDWMVGKWTWLMEGRKSAVRFTILDFIENLFRFAFTSFGKDRFCYRRCKYRLPAVYRVLWATVCTLYALLGVHDEYQLELIKIAA